MTRLRFSGTSLLLQRAAIAALACVGATALAQSTLTYNDGDLLLGFRSTDGTSDYVVNLGQPSQFISASSGTSATVNVGNIATDLSAVFGSDWYSRVDAATGTSAVKYSIVGAREVASGGDPANTLYASSTSAVPWQRQSDPAQSYTSSLVAALGNKFAGNASTANNAQGFIENAATNNSYASFQPGGKNSQGISFQTWNPSNEGSPISRLYLYQIKPGSGPSTLLGSFTLSSSGQLSFTAGSSPIAQFQNISTRLNVLAGDNAGIAGFIISGSDPKKVIIRGIGPSLTQPDGVTPLPGRLADPTLDLFAGGASTPMQSNDNWADTQAAEVTASGIPPKDPKESAIVATLNPGFYTAVLRGKGDTTGIGVVEAYDLSGASNSQLANISTRGFVDVGDNVMIGGTILGPQSTNAARVLIRAIGPSLSKSNVSNPLADPTLTLKDGNGNTVLANDNWKDSQQADIQATGIAPTDDKESAILATLSPGVPYTAIVAGNGANATGVGLVELYNLQ